MSKTLSNYPEFRQSAKDLQSNIGTMLCKMDGVIAATKYTDARKEEMLLELSDQYLA
jgi:hypothetical protein